MKTTEIILIVSAILIVSLRLYKKYTEKNKSGTGYKVQGGDSFHKQGKDDGYEPYANKRKQNV